MKNNKRHIGVLTLNGAEKECAVVKERITDTGVLMFDCAYLVRGTLTRGEYRADMVALDGFAPVSKKALHAKLV
jgi:hypothetical protein